jgi:hypothetical protein
MAVEARFPRDQSVSALFSKNPDSERQASHIPAGAARIPSTSPGQTMIETDAQYQEAERRLNEWGSACRETMQGLGLPTISNLAETLAHVQRQDREEKSDRRKKLRAERDRRRRLSLPPMDPKEVAEINGFIEHDKTAKGKSTRLGAIPTQVLESRILQMDRIVASAEKWMQAALKRSYMFHQPDKNAAQDLRLPKREYSLRRMASVDFVAVRLDIERRRK